MEREVKEIGFDTAKGRVPIRVVKIENNKTGFTKSYFNKIDIAKSFRNKQVVATLLDCDKTSVRGYINLGDFLQVTKATSDTEFFVYVQNNFIEDNADSSIYKDLLTLKKLCSIVYDNKEYNDKRDEVGFYDLLSQDLMHEQELNGMNNREVLEWNKKFNALRIQRRTAKNEVAFRDAVRGAMKPTKKNKEELNRLLSPDLYYAAKKVYKPRIDKQRRKEWEKSVESIKVMDYDSVQIKDLELIEGVG